MNHQPQILIEPEHRDRTLYTAIREKIYLDFFSEPIAQIFIEKKKLRLLIFDPIKEVLVKWIN